MARTLVSLPTYNEKDNIEPILKAILESLDGVEALVIDDASPDGTGAVVERIAVEQSRVHVLHRAGKEGLGSAHMAGMRHAMESGFDYVITMDADFSHSPKYLPALVAGMDDHDVMIGSRYVPGGGVTGWNWKRKFMSAAINIYTRLLLPIKARDASGGFRCYRVAKLKEIDFRRVRSTGYSFQEEFLFRCHQVGCRIGETPIIFDNRKFGVSKINQKEALVALWVLFVTALRR